MGLDLIGGGNNAIDAFVLTGDQVGVLDPMLGLLQDNGGPTETHALFPGSLAIDAGDPGFTSPPDYDQRGVGYQRVYGAAIDIGAYERQTLAPSFFVVLYLSKL